VNEDANKDRHEVPAQTLKRFTQISHLQDLSCTLKNQNYLAELYLEISSIFKS
jgi:hypothetical protein